MATLLNILDTGRSSLIAHQSAISTAASNTANSGVDGYSKRTVRLGSLGANAGVAVQSVRRRADIWIERRLLVERSRLGTNTVRASGLNSMELQLGNGEAGLAASIDEFFASLRSLSANPQEQNRRSDVLAKAETLTSTFNNTATRIGLERQQADNVIEDAVIRANEIALEVADLNARIRRTEAGGIEASGDRDRRNTLLGELADYISVSVLDSDDGSFTVLLNGGLALVQGDSAASLVATEDPALGGFLRVDYVDQAGLATDLTSSTRSGKIGGLLQMRDDFLFDLSSQVDQLAFDFANAFNAQHQLGFGTDGVTGRNFFAPPGGVAGAAELLSLVPGLDSAPAAIATAFDAATSEGGNENLLTLIALADVRLAAGGTKTAIEEISAIVSDVGRESAAQRRGEEQTSLQVIQVAAMKDAQTGVSLDEELIDIARFERGYQAAARIISTVEQMFDTLLQL